MLPHTRVTRLCPAPTPTAAKGLSAYGQKHTPPGGGGGGARVGEGAGQWLTVKGEFPGCQGFLLSNKTEV